MLAAAEGNSEESVGQDKGNWCLTTDRLGRPGSERKRSMCHALPMDTTDLDDTLGRPYDRRVRFSAQLDVRAVNGGSGNGKGEARRRVRTQTHTHTRNARRQKGRWKGQAHGGAVAKCRMCQRRRLGVDSLQKLNRGDGGGSGGARQKSPVLKVARDSLRLVGGFSRRSLAVHQRPGFGDVISYQWRSRQSACAFDCCHI